MTTKAATRKRQTFGPLPHDKAALVEEVGSLRREVAGLRRQLDDILGQGHLWLLSGATMIARERSGHTLKGYTDEHDDAQDNGELIEAAICYLLAPSARSRWPWPNAAPPVFPVTVEDRIEQLVIAGSLVAAEIDRLRRTQFPPELDLGIIGEVAEEDIVSPLPDLEQQLADALLLGGEQQRVVWVVSRELPEIKATLAELASLPLADREARLAAIRQGMIQSVRDFNRIILGKEEG